MEERDPLLSEAYRSAEHPEPSPALDARILDAARRAVAPPRRRSAWLTWAVPLSTTAVLVLGITLLFRIQREAPDSLREAMPTPASPAPAIPDVPAAGSTPSRAGPAAESTWAEKRSRAADASVPAARERPATAPAPVQAMPDTTRAAPMSRESVAESAAGAGPEPHPFPARPAPAPHADSAGKALSAPPSASRASDDHTRLERMASPAAAPSRDAAPVRQGVSGTKAASPGMTGPHVTSPAMAGPEQWVESIRGLLKAGRSEEARQYLDQLRTRYPGYVLPDDLRALAGD